MFVVIIFIYLNLVKNCLANNRIVGGRTTTIENYPYQLSLRYNGIHICGAALVSLKVALSAAHCFPKAGSYTVKAGSTKLYSGGYIIPVKAAILHPLHSHENEDYDVAILKLLHSIRPSSTVKPVDLPRQNEEPLVGWYGTVTGWGYMSNNYPSMSDALRAVELPVLPLDWCRNRYMYVQLTPQMFCAGFKDGGRDSCQGDSGGPFVINNTLYGIVSWGFNCAVPGYPGIYTNIAVLVDYIRKNADI